MLLAKVKISSTEINERTGTYKSGANEGQDYVRRHQRAYIEIGEARLPMAIELEEGSSALATGWYLASLDEFITTNQYDALVSRSFASPMFIPVTAKFIEQFDKLQDQISELLDKVNSSVSIVNSAIPEKTDDKKQQSFG